MNVRDINTKNWQLALDSSKTVVTGMDDVRQCIDVILRTRKGEDPLRPHFGCGIFNWIDKPNTVSIPNMKKEILDAIKQFEPRVSVTRIDHHVVFGGVAFNLLYKNPDGTSTKADFEVNNQPAYLTLSAGYETGQARYNINLMLDNALIFPQPPAVGFTSIADLMFWVNQYWTNFGTWFWAMGQNQILVSVPGNIATQGALSISTPAVVLTAPLTLLQPNEFYVIAFFDQNGDRIQPYSDDTLITYSAVLQFAQNNYGQYGEWGIENNTLIVVGDATISGFSLSASVDNINSAFNVGFNIGFNA